MKERIKCEICNAEYDIELPSPVGPEGATEGVYRGGGFCVYIVSLGEVCPWCPECGYLQDTQTFIPNVSMKGGPEWIPNDPDL